MRGYVLIYSDLCANYAYFSVESSRTFKFNVQIHSMHSKFKCEMPLCLSSKTSRGAPAYRVFMRRPPSSPSSSSSTLSTSSSPSASDLKTLFSSYRDGAPLLFASVAEGDDPSFVAYYDVTLPPAPVHFDVV